METRLVQVLRANGLPEPVPQHEIWNGTRFVARVDAAYPQWRIAIEYDSVEHHAGATAIRRDSARRNRIWSAGWYPLTATKDDIDDGGVVLYAAITVARDQRAS